MDTIKKELHALCIKYAKDRIDTATQAINSSKESANEETKSSAGDKYETSREMMQQETDRHQSQLNEANKLIVTLNQMSGDGVFTTADPGSLVITDNGKFYIVISAGALQLNGETYFAVSPVSPVALALKGKKAGDEFSLNGKQYKINKVL
jgi:transcription elongation GreA/GreB family factor